LTLPSYYSENQNKIVYICLLTLKGKEIGKHKYTYASS